jgi:hypothetical protein
MIFDQKNLWNVGFPAKLRILVHFHFVTHNLFPESGSNKRFQDSEMRTIDSPYKITPIGVILGKNYHIILGPSPNSHMGVARAVSSRGQTGLSPSLKSKK